jgi:hypothetical protein
MALAKLTEYVHRNRESGGHFTIFKYSGNYRVMIGTPNLTDLDDFKSVNGLDDIAGHAWIPVGDTLSEAVDAAIEAHEGEKAGRPYRPLDLETKKPGSVVKTGP